jgi:hypothetical protein
VELILDRPVRGYYGTNIEIRYDGNSGVKDIHGNLATVSSLTDDGDPDKDRTVVNNVIDTVFKSATVEQRGADQVIEVTFNESVQMNQDNPVSLLGADVFTLWGDKAGGTPYFAQPEVITFEEIDGKTIAILRLDQYTSLLDTKLYLSYDSSQGEVVWDHAGFSIDSFERAEVINKPDKTPPKLIKAWVPKASPTSLVLEFNEPVTAERVDSFSIEVYRGNRWRTVSIASFVAAGDEFIYLTLATSISYGQDIRIAYDSPEDEADWEQAVIDLSRNPLGDIAFDAVPVDNNLTPPDDPYPPYNPPPYNPPPGPDDPTPTPTPEPTPDPTPTPTPNPESPTANERVEIAEPPFSPPAGIETANGARTVTETEMKDLMENLGLDASLVVGSDGSVSVSEGAFTAGLNEETVSAIDNAAPITPLPVFRTGVSTGGSALVTLKVRLDDYTGKAFGSMAVLKMKYDRSVDVLGSAVGKDSLKAGAYIWTDAAGNAIASSDKVAAGGSYCMSVVIEDGSGYDLDFAPGTIVDPLALAAKKADSGDSEPAAGDDETEGADAPASGGGGGCDVGLGAFAAFALAALTFTTSQRRIPRR